MKIEEYLNNIKQKELIYLFISIPIVVFIIYNNFIYNNMQEENKKLISKEKSVKQKLIKVSSEIRKIKNSKKDLKQTMRRLQNMQEEFKFLKYSFNKLNLIKLSDTRSYFLLKKLLEKSNVLKLNSSFSIKWDEETKPFNQTLLITISGNAKYVDIIKYLQFIENLDALIIVESVKISLGSLSKEEEDVKLSKQYLLKYLEEQKKKEDKDSSLSFILTQYSDRDLEYFKSLANDKLSVSVSRNSSDINYFDVSFSGEDYQIKNLSFDIERRKKLKSINFIKKQMKIVAKHKVSKKEKEQVFVITLKIVGVK
jgi:Tfp pilus assembly protein PilO